MVILKGYFNDRYVSNATCIAFSFQDTVINATIEGIDWSIIATCLLRVKPIISSDTLLNRCSDIIIFQER